MKQNNYLLAISAVLGVLFCWLLYKSWVVFGFWTLTWTGIVTFMSSLFLKELKSGRSEKDGIITFNPKELPKLINMGVSILIGWYLYSIANQLDHSTSDYIFGICYILLLVGAPIIWSIYIIIRDRNDFVEINATHISYRDNSERDAFAIAEIETCDFIAGEIKIKMKNGDDRLIPLGRMNFNSADKTGLALELKKLFPKAEETSKQ